MSDLFMLSKKQFNRIEPYFPLPYGVPRVDDLRAVSGIVYVIRNGPAVEGRTPWLWPSQDAVQPLCTLEQDGRVQQDIRGTRRQGRHSGPADD